MSTRDLDLLISIYKHLNAEGSRPDLAAALGRLVQRKAAPYRTSLSLTRAQVESDIPYRIVYEVRNGAQWETPARKRWWVEEFTAAERTAAARLFTQADNWSLRTGIPTTVRMTEETYDLWQKLGDFCSSL